jgi:hypothetical protein
MTPVKSAAERNEHEHRQELMAMLKTMGARGAKLILDVTRGGTIKLPDDVVKILRDRAAGEPVEAPLEERVVDPSDDAVF